MINITIIQPKLLGDICKCRQEKLLSQQRRASVNEEAERACPKVGSYNHHELMCSISLDLASEFADHTKDDNDDNILCDKPQTEFKESNGEKSESYSCSDHGTLSFPNNLPFSVDEYTDVFEKLFIDRKSNDLKQEIITDLMSLEGVETAAVGFSTEKEVNYWPVIRVSPNEVTCRNIMESTKECFVDKIASTLQASLLKISVVESYSRLSLKSAVEVILNYPLKESVLRTTGEILTTTYKYIDHDQDKYKKDKRTGTTTCNIQSRVIISKHGRQRVYPAQYQIACLHPIVPTNSQCFCQVLPPLPRLSGISLSDPNAHASKSLKYEFIDHVISELVHAVGPANDSYLMPTILQLTLFPEHASLAFEKVKEHFKCEVDHVTFFRNNLSRNHEVKFLFGKAGLFEQNNLDFLFVLTDSSALGNPFSNPFRRHPCNIDIGVYDYMPCQEANEMYECTLETVFDNLQAEGGIDLPQKPSWKELPPEGGIKDKRGTVVYIREGVVRKLSDQLSIIKSVILGGHIYPTYVWKLDPQSNVSPGDSGSPVLLLREDTFYFMGSLITDTIASPIHFGLQIIGVDIALHNVEKIISQLKESQVYSTPVVPLEDQEFEDNNTCDIDVDDADLIKYLEKYKSWLESHKEEQSLSPLPTVMLSELNEENTIQANMEFKVELNLT